MNALVYALKVFFIVLRKKDHIFSSDEYYSFVGDRRKVMKLQQDISESWNDGVNQQNILNEAKQILKHEKD